MTDLRSAPVPAPGPDDHVRGPTDGPVVVLYADFTCPRCAVAWGRLEDAPVRLAFRHLALKAKHPRAVALALAAEAVARQGEDRFWALVESLYDDQGHVDDPHLWARCAELGIDVDRFQADRRDPAVEALVKGQVRDALRGGATVTPSVFAGADLYPGVPSVEQVEAWAAGRGDPHPG